MIGVIGAGPVGAYFAYKSKEEVTLFEEDSSIGKPVQCTGIVTSQISKLVKLEDSFVVNKINRAEIISPSGFSLNVKIRKPDIVLDRMKFDKHIVNLAKSKGVKVLMKHKFKDFSGNFDLKFSNGKSYSVDKLVGADGPFSLVAKKAGIYGQRRFVNGFQARVKDEFESDLVKFYPSSKGFGWVVPESSKIARVGVVSYGNSKLFLKSILKKGKVLEYNGGVVPLYDRKVVTEKDNVFLIGDAAGQVKSTTFGGIVPGMICADSLAESFSSNKIYTKLWKSRVGKELFLGSVLRKKMDKFSDKKYDNLIKEFSSSKMKDILGKIDRDNIVKLLLKVVLNNPKVVRFGL